MLSRGKRISLPRLSPGGKGTDQLGERYAWEKRLPNLIFKPDYAKFGKSVPLPRQTASETSLGAVTPFLLLRTSSLRPVDRLLGRCSAWPPAICPLYRVTIDNNQLYSLKKLTVEIGCYLTNSICYPTDMPFGTLILSFVTVCLTPKHLLI